MSLVAFVALVACSSSPDDEGQTDSSQLITKTNDRASLAGAQAPAPPPPAPGAIPAAGAVCSSFSVGGCLTVGGACTIGNQVGTCGAYNNTWNYHNLNGPNQRAGWDCNVCQLPPPPAPPVPVPVPNPAPDAQDDAK